MLPLFQHFNHKHAAYFSLFPTKNLSFVPHIHIDYEVIYVLEGTVEVTIDTQTYILYPSDVCFIYSHQVHSFHTPEYSNTLLLIINPQLVSSIFKHATGLVPTHPVIHLGPANKEVKHMLLALHQEQQTLQNTCVMNGYIHIVMGRIHGCTTFSNRLDRNTSSLQLVLKYMSNHYTEPITLEHLSSDLGLSTSYISLIFKSHIGFNFSFYRNYLRVNLAQTLLLESNLAVTEIAYQCGFESLRSFNRAFKKVVGTSPTQYKLKASPNI